MMPNLVTSIGITKKLKAKRFEFFYNSDCASSNLCATSRAISTVSATVRHWATNPCKSSEVAR
jgi:hypothetical protein